MEKNELKLLIVESLERQGFRVDDSHLVPLCELNKGSIRNLHSEAVQHRINRAADGLRRHESRLLSHIAAGHEVIPQLIVPRLVEVQPNSEEELLFRYATLHWSIPVSSGYGRRLRFLVIDEHNDKLIGLIGLGDPVFSLSSRDAWVGWSREERRRKLQHVMDAFVLGAVPPYSNLLCGKLVALLAASNEVRLAFRKKYANRPSLISQRPFNGQLVMLTTNSALGRSAIYNRLKFKGRLIFKSVGFTSGSGDFHFANGLYEQIRAYAESNCEPTAKQADWGKGFRNRREVVRKALAQLGLSSDLQYHGIRREIFVIPLASNAKEFLVGLSPEPNFYDQSVADLFMWFKERWLLPRSLRDRSYQAYDRRSFAIWSPDTAYAGITTAVDDDQENQTQIVEEVLESVT